MSETSIISSIHTSFSLSASVRFGAVSLAIYSLLTVPIALFELRLIPIQTLIFAMYVFGCWIFAIEMGMEKPLVRAGMVALSFAAFGKTMILMWPAGQVPNSFGLLFAFMSMSAILLWSVAFLHRPGQMKLFGGIGLAASLLPISLLIIGHLVVGFGAFWGISELYGYDGETDLSALRNVELIQSGWALLTAT